MYARMTELQGFTGDVDAAIQTVRDTVVTRARDLDGFKGFLGFVDRDTKAFVSFTLWESEDAMRASEESANQLRSEVNEMLHAGTPTVKRFEAAIVEMPAAVTA
jgi:heme-degrading monooxygenase HmoA